MAKATCKSASEFIQWVQEHYGLCVSKNTSEGAIGGKAYPGAWKTGWTVSGAIPGGKHDYYWYPSLAAVRRAFTVTD